jgi:hypothetical protein
VYPPCGECRVRRESGRPGLALDLIIARIAARHGSRRDGDLAMTLFASYVIGQCTPPVPLLKSPGVIIAHGAPVTLVQLDEPL